MFAEARVDVLLAQPADPAVRSEVVETMAGSTPPPTASAPRRCGSPTRRERADAIRVPTLVVCGDRGPDHPAGAVDLADAD